ncbi:MAG: hypothetical protein Q4F44_00510 [Bacteroidales bacterium]|nr:hypothetical protein [Bacteroidales bacterium]
MNKKLITILLGLIAFVSVYADNGINSPYSRYGIGILNNQGLGVNRQMGGLGYALRSNSYINILNPASFSAADTLTMLFEAGMTLQNVNFKEGNRQINAKNASFDYIAMQFRVRKGLGVSLGFLPYSTVGYSFSTVSNQGSNETSTDTYSGSGGIYQPYIGIGWQPIKGLSIGAMASYIYGDIDHNVSIDFANSTDRSRTYNVSVRSYKLDLGAQYLARIADNHSIMLGATYSLGHNLNADASITDATSSSTNTTKIDDGFKLPHTYGFGLMYNYKENWRFGADYTLQQWGTSTFFGRDNGCDRSRVAIGAEYTPTKPSNNILKMMSYRAGAYYSQPYTEINGKNGCEEFGVSAGFSIPFVNRNNKYSFATLHVSGQYVHINPKSTGMIEENCLRINIGITFNEAWFMKMKVR